ncbi:MAG: hypothetical protein WBZ29_05275 [Methanocella sp.]
MAGIAIIIIGLLVQTYISAQSGTLKVTALQIGFEISDMSIYSIIIIAAGFVILAGGILWGLFGEGK